MTPKFNIDRPKISEEEINQHKDFNQLVKQFKQQSVQKARQDKSWWKSKKVRYSSVIAGITVVCTISYFALFNKTQNQNTNDKIVTQKQETGNKTQEARRFVLPPSKKLAIPYSSYKINNSKGGEINHNTASKIKIPKNSFVDKNGKDVIGDVTIEYREFHDKGDIIASGIPMAYDSAGKKSNLESAGMFDIQGTQNGEPVFIKEGNNLNVELASASSEDRFNQYYLDTLEKNWKYLKHDKIIATASKPKSVNKENHNQHDNNSKILKLKEEIEVIIPKKIDSVKVVYTKRAETLPKAKEPSKPSKPTGRPTFVLDANKSEYPELAAFDNVIFEIGEENRNYNKSFNDITWNDVKVSEGPDKGRNYLLTLVLRNRIEKLIVYPVLTGSDFEKAQKKYQQKFGEYQALVVKREADEKKLLAEMEAKQQAYMAQLKQKQAEYEKARINAEVRNINDLNTAFNSMSNQERATRLFSISKFGIYNSDCARGVANGKNVSPVFITGENEKPLMPDVIYMIDHTANTVYSFGRNDLAGKIKYDPNSGNSFVVFSGSKMYLCNKESFKQTTDKEGYKFSVTALPDNSENLPDFKKALEI
ncbi:MAG: hypothetical protein H0W61_14105 [Bacteroidetes bacterium]|nr:hypothetical protein [Bacteroidota bacterium]